MSHPPCRVVLLLDLDCFYAQCERVRLGLDASNAEVALLQWNSTLAVSYPARRHGIKRGDSWEDVKSKSQGTCLAIHLPILKIGQDPQQDEATAAADAKNANVKDAYEQEYVLSKEQRQRIMAKEVGVKRYAHEGKACLERYRLASTRIFSVVLDSLIQKLGKNKFILERASIDELFLDATEYCWETLKNRPRCDERMSVMAESVIVGKDAQEKTSGLEEDENVRIMLELGSVVAKQVRAAVLDTLGFTLSAGISVNKVVAKLGASYGKPNGQAVIFPWAIPKVMDETKIRKVRNFGRKLGKRVQALLPSEEETMGSIARLLSLPVLCRELGSETGKMVYDACRGIDAEPVKETVGALVKSITAFKSFSQTLLTSDTMTKWISLLATDVVSRVEQDCVRNERYPQSLSIHYAYSKGDQDKERTTRSIRIPFPRATEGQKRSNLVHRVQQTILAKEGAILMYRVGLCASDFEPRLRNGISSYFSKGVKDKNVDTHTQQKDAEPEGNRCEEKMCNDEEFARKLQQEYNREMHQQDSGGGQPRSSQAVIAETESVCEKDQEYARKLQATFDREDYVLATVESRPSKRCRSKAAAQNGSSKKMRLDNFFRKA